MGEDVDDDEGSGSGSDEVEDIKCQETIEVPREMERQLSSSGTSEGPGGDEGEDEMARAEARLTYRSNS